HVSGESIEFSALDAIGWTSRKTLLSCLSLMTVTAIVIPHYKQGIRNDVALALAGTLLRHGVSEQDVLHVFEALCDLTCDDEKKGRLATVAVTSDRHEKGQPNRQDKHLAELIGQDAVEAIRANLERATYPKTLSPAAPSTLLLPDDLNDSGVAKLFADQAKDRILFDADSDAFAIYGDGIWTVDPKGLQISQEFDRTILTRVETLSSDNSLPQEQW